jgi:hypothetical protein
LRPAGDLENEDKLTADRYRKQLETKLRPEAAA